MTNKRFFISPLIEPLIFLIIGIFLQKNYPLPIIFIYLSLGTTFFCLLLNNILYKKTLKLLIYCASFFMGACLLFLQLNEHKNLQEQYCYKQITAIGTIQSIEKKITGKHKEALIVSISTIKKDSIIANQYTLFNLLIYTKKQSTLLPGDYIAIEPISLNGYNKQSKTTLTEFTQYLIKENIKESIFLSENSSINLINRPKWSFLRTTWKIKSSLYNSIQKKLTHKSASLFGLVFLGNKNQCNLNSLRDTFSYWGLSHYLARSGLHIVLFIMILMFLFKYIPIHLLYKKILLLMLTIIYSILSWSSISFFRAYIVFLLIEIGSLWDFSPNTLHILTLTCLWLLLTNPIQIFFLDFQLTFLLTFGLLFLKTLASPYS